MKSRPDVVVDIQLRFAPLVVALMVGPVPCAGAQSASAGVRACFAQKDPTRRLACYDAEVGKMIFRGTADQFGVDGELLQKRLKEGTEPAQPHELTARVTGVTH